MRVLKLHIVTFPQDLVAKELVITLGPLHKARERTLQQQVVEAEREQARQEERQKRAEERERQAQALPHPQAPLRHETGGAALPARFTLRDERGRPRALLDLKAALAS